MLLFLLLATSAVLEVCVAVALRRSGLWIPYGVRAYGCPRRNGDCVVRAIPDFAGTEDRRTLRRADRRVSVPATSHARRLVCAAQPLANV